MRKSVEERFWEKVDIKSPEECWAFNSARTKAGYGLFWNGSKAVYAHRFAYETHNKYKIPSGKLIRHSCDNPICCNPHHLICGTDSDNMLDRIIRGGYQKLTALEILNIRKLNIPINGYIRKNKYSQRTVAKMFNISQGLVWQIWNSKRTVCKEGYLV